MLTMHTDVLTLASSYARIKQIAASTLSREATGSSTWLKRCESGRVTIRSAIAVVQWLSEHWPDDFDWPSDIPRPAPTRGSFSASYLPDRTVLSSDVSEVHIGDIGRNFYNKYVDISPPQAVNLGMQLNASGRIASPAAFCQALGVRRYVYDDVVRRYRDETCAGRNPRPGSKLQPCACRSVRSRRCTFCSAQTRGFVVITSILIYNLWRDWVCNKIRGFPNGRVALRHGHSRCNWIAEENTYDW